MYRKAKIVCTIGPASCSREVILGLIRRGMDVARLNFSHGDHEFHEKALRTVRQCAEKLGRPVAVLQDLQGIKIRTGPMRGGAIELKRGREILVAQGKGEGTKEKIYINYKHLLNGASIGSRILINDGLIELAVTGKGKDCLKTKVVEGGTLEDRKGVNLPGMAIKARSFTQKDKEDLLFGLKIGVDYVAVSFVRTAEDIVKVKKAIGKRGIPVIAKIEKPEAVENIEAILDVSDGIMVARGDLGVEVSPEEVPILQKKLIRLANQSGRLVITATQMLESMTVHTTPTRAEAADVANAVIDGSDALMLSAETSSGKYPLRAVSMMDRIIRRTEKETRTAPVYMQRGSFSEAVAEAAAEAAGDTGSKFVVAFTHSGYTARIVSKFRPHVPIVAFTPFTPVAMRMSLYWGVIPETLRPLGSTDDVFAEVERMLLKKKLASPGQSIVITASAPIGGEGKTNLMKLHRIEKNKNRVQRKQ